MHYKIKMVNIKERIILKNCLYIYKQLYYYSLPHTHIYIYIYTGENERVWNELKLYYYSLVISTRIKMDQQRMIQISDI